MCCTVYRDLFKGKPLRERGERKKLSTQTDSNPRPLDQAAYTLKLCSATTTAQEEKWESSKVVGVQLQVSVTSQKLTIVRRQFVEGVFVDEVPPDVDVDGLALLEVGQLSLVLIPIFGYQVLEQLK